MIVVGSYGERPLKGALVGSTPHKLIHLSERPVIVVRVHLNKMTGASTIPSATLTLTPFCDGHRACAT